VNSGRPNEVRKTLVLSGVVHIGQGYIDSVEQDLEIRQVAVGPAEHVDPGSAVDETADPERASA